MRNGQNRPEIDEKTTENHGKPMENHAKPVENHGKPQRSSRFRPRRPEALHEIHRAEGALPQAADHQQVGAPVGRGALVGAPKLGAIVAPHLLHPQEHLLTSTISTIFHDIS